MSIVLVYIESIGNLVSKANLPIISAALSAKTNFGASKIIGVLIGGAGTKEASESISEYGLDEVLYFQNDTLSKYNAIDYANCLYELAKQISPKYVLSLANSRGRDFIPRVAAKLDCAQASDVISFIANGNYQRPIYAGNIISEISLLGSVHCVTVRASAFDQPMAVSTKSSVIEANIQFIPTDKIEVISFDTVKSERPELGEADIIVSGGRALKSSENFENVMFPLADALGAAVGASRAAVDSGYAPNDWQVGQTGKIVAPKLYIAVGISGAVQHLAGMKDSKVIVAINKDPEAPIFEVADYGLVADLFEVVPELVKQIKD